MMKRKCDQCGKEVSSFKIKQDLTTLRNVFCSNECLKKFKEEKAKNKGKIKEIKNKCNQCGKVWHYLESDITQLRVRGVANAMGGMGTCCNPFAFYMLNKSNEVGDQIKEMQRCPECKSMDITKKTVYHEKE